MPLMDKIYNGLKHHAVLLNLLVILSFIVLSILSISLIWSNGTLHIMGDGAFHIGRFYELVKSKALFPEYALNSFSGLGVAVMAMYPYVFLYVTAIIFYVVKSVKLSFFIAFAVWTFITLIISFYSSLSLSKSRLMSYAFAVVYALSGEFTTMYFLPALDLGVYFSTVFLPLVIFGFIYYFKANRWLMLSIGMSMIICSSTISFVVVAFLMLLWTLINLRSIIKDRKWFNLLKAAFLTVITTAFIWMPLISVMHNNKMAVPTNNNVGSITLTNIFIHAVDNNFLPNSSNQMLTLYSLAGIILGIILFKKLPHYLRQTYCFGVFVTLFSSSIIPWTKMTGDSWFCQMMQKMQSSIRMLFVPQVIFEFIFAYALIHYLKRHRKSVRLFFIAGLTLFVVVLQLASQEMYINSNQGTVPNFSKAKAGIVNVQYKDYWPKASISQKNNLFNHIGTSKNNQNIQFTPLGNGKFSFNDPNNDNESITVPFLYYHGAEYKCYVDHKRVTVHPNKHQLLTLNHVKNGQHHLKISVPFSVLTLFSRAVSILSVLVYLMIIITRLKNLTLNHFGGLKKRIKASK